MTIVVRPVGEGDLDWVHALMDEHWGGQTQVENGEVHRPADFPAFVAVEEARKLKPTIPPTGEGGVPVTDEIEYELSLA